MSELSLSDQKERNLQAQLFYTVQQSNNESAIGALIAAGAKVNKTDVHGETALFYAVRKRKKESVVRALIGVGADVNMTDEHGRTSLFYAVQQSNNASVVRVLIDAGADVNKTDLELKTPLFYAVQQCNNDSVVHLLIAAGAEVNKVDTYARTALSYAVQQVKNESVVRALIGARADVNITDEHGETALFHAVKQIKNESVVRTLIKARADINMTDEYGRTALFHAVQQCNNESVFRALIAAGAKVNMTDKYRKTALFYAIKQTKNDSMVHALIDAGVNVNMTDEHGEAALFYAVRKRKKESMVHALIAADADVNMTDEHGETALFHAVRKRKKGSVVRALIDARADVNMTDKHGRTALFYAVQQVKNESVVRALIDAGANVNMTDEHGETALGFAACQSNNESVVRALIKPGAHVNMTDENGIPVLFCAVISKDGSVVRALIDAGADVNMTNEHGKTALFLAVQQSNNENVVRTLIKAGADIDTTDEHGKTALFNAVQQSNNESVVRVLIAAGAKVNMTDKYRKTTLFYAVQQINNESVVRALIGVGADVNMTDEHGRTALFYAVQQSNNESVTRVLIDVDTDVNKTDFELKTPLFYAAQQCNNDSVVRLLIAAGAKVNKVDTYARTALSYAVQQVENECVVRALIGARADVNTTDEHGETALFHAVKQIKNESVVRALIDAGANVNMTDEHMRTAFFYAVQQCNNESVVRALIEARANVNMTDKYRKTALFYAIKQTKNDSMLHALIAAGADVNKTDEHGETALFHAVKQGRNESVVLALIDAGADINMTDENGETTLFHAVRHSTHESVIRALISSIGYKDIFGRTAHFYVDLKYPSTLRCLLEAGGNRYLRLMDNCNVDVVTFLIEKWVSSKELSFDCFKHGILDVLAKNGIKYKQFAKAIVNILSLKVIGVSRGKYENIFNKSTLRRTVEGIKSFFRHESLEKKAKMENILKLMTKNETGPECISEALKLLAELDADPDTADSDGNTVLHYTTHLSLLGVQQDTVIDLCKHLERFGAQINRRNHQHQTPLLFCLSADMHQLTDKDFPSAAKTLVKVCMFLVKQGTNVDETSKSGESVFHLIIKFFDRCLKVEDEVIRNDVIQEALNLLHLFPSSKVATENTINKADLHNNTPLHLWASLSLPRGYMSDVFKENLTFKALLDEILKHFSECEANVNARNKNDETPLHLCKTWTAVELLLNAGAKPKDVDSSGRSPLLVAAKKNLFRQKTDNFYPDVTEEPETFWRSALAKGLDPWTADKEGESVLSVLIQSEAFVLAKALVEDSCAANCATIDIKLSSLNTICKDESRHTHWKTILVEIILKSASKSHLSLDSPLRFCCRNIVQFGMFEEKSDSFQQKTKDKAINDDREPPSTEIRRKDESARDAEKQESSVEQATYESVHCKIAKQLLSYGGVNISTRDSSGESCLDIAEYCPPLQDLLTRPLAIDTISILIPWTSVSGRYKGTLAKVARRQECEMVDQIWYHNKHIGRGAFGHVFPGINEKDGREVAIKRIEKLHMQRPEDKREIEHLTALADCEQVVHYLSFFEDDHFSYICLELMEGNLEEYLKGTTTSATLAILLCKDVLMGLKFLHEQKILHRDLKPQNILYKVLPKLCLKIADFGLSRRISDNTSPTVYNTNAGTRCWKAQELLTSSKNFSESSDMFSCGLLLHYILSKRKHPFNPKDCANKPPQQVANETEANLIKGEMEGWDDSLSPEATHLVKRMLESNEKNRPSAAEALEHPLFWSNEKKVDFLEAVGNQTEFECPRSKRTPPLTPVETDIENSYSTLVTNGKCKWPWDDPGYLYMSDIHTEMTKGKGRKKYDTSSVVELVRFMRNVYEHYREKKFVFPTAVTIEQLLFEDFVFLEYFPDLVMEVYKAVTTHGWDQTRDDIKYAMNKK